MNHSLVILPQSFVKITVTVPFSEFEPYVRRAAMHIAEKVEIEGFRKGKAPYEIVKQRVGESRMYEQAAEDAIRATWPDILKEIGTREPFLHHPLIGNPEFTITKVASGNEFQYQAQCAYIPAIKLPDYRKIAQRVLNGSPRNTTVSDQELEKTLQWIRESRAELIAIARAAAPGDAVEIDFDMRHGGVNIEQGSARNHLFILGKAKFIPGFEDQLVGMNIGEEKTFTLVVPADWRDGSLAGKALDVRVLMRSVKEQKIPELTDDFVKTLGNFEHKDQLIEHVRDGLAQEKQEKEKQRIRILILDEIAKNSEIDAPDVLISSEQEKMLMELKSGVETMGMQWNDYLLHIKKTPEILKAEWYHEAVRRVRAALCLREIGNFERIEPTEEEITQAANQYLTKYDSPDEAKKTIDPQALRDYSSGTIRNEKVFEFLENVE